MTLSRLQLLKRRYDPKGVFAHNLPFPMTPACDAARV
ncbi:MAG: BBE domain-containing protein [Candidatus Dormibacteraeota bacterium]|nr:BBE domain-containing protein [Candidatus Dormibacteraeota bacterium]